MLIFLTGPSAAGKSTTAKLLASKWHKTCALIDFDKIRTFIKSGYVEPAIEWNDKAKQQWDLAKEVVTEMSKIYNKHDVDVVLEVFATPNDFENYKDLLKDLNYKFVVLLPTLESAIIRNNQRKGLPKLKEKDIRQNYEWSEGWRNIKEAIIIDNTDLTVEETVDEIIKQKNGILEKLIGNI